MGEDTHQKRFTRRQVVGMAGVGAVVAGGLGARWLLDDDAPSTRDAAARRTTTTQRATTDPSVAGDAAPWSDPATWDGKVPGPEDVAVVTRPVLLDVDAAVAGVQVEAGAELQFDPAASRTLTSTGNVVVAGALRARPQASEVVHRLVFDGVDESRMAGGHTMAPLDTDVGLWVVGSGALDLHGSPKKAWTTLTDAVDAGSDSIDVEDAEGWQPGDEVVVTPTAATTTDDYAVRHDRRQIAAVDGTTITLDAPLEFDHPAVTARPGRTHHAEVLNLTRNVCVESAEEGGQAHVMLVALDVPQQMSWVALRRMGPPVSGRYSLHFHMNGDATRSTVVEGVVAHDGGNHAFVPHLSDGITFRDCIAHDQVDTAYWWDQPDDNPDGDGPERIATNDLTYERCVASHLRPTDDSTLAGFLLAPGRGQIARGCVAVGILEDDEGTPAYLWTGDSLELEHAWVFEDCLSHNNAGSSIYYWNNGVPPSSVDGFTAYHDRHGIRAGAYTNFVSYRDCTVFGCAEMGLVIEAVPGTDEGGDATVTYENVHVDQAGLSDYAAVIGGHVVAADRATRVVDCSFAGGTVAQVGIEGTEYPQIYEFVDCAFDGNALWIDDGMTGPVDITLDDAEHGVVRVMPAGRDGEPKPDWNASVRAS
jgi:hypothetical protein